MLKNLIQRQITIGAGDTASDFWDFDLEIQGKLPRVRKVTVLNDLSSARNEVTISLVENSKKIPFLDNVHAYALTSDFEEKFDIDYPGSRYNYTIQNTGASSVTLTMCFELEYPL